jgi:hypothetical protein
MPSNRWLKRPARALRDLAIHAHMRAELLPRLPFVVALVVSAVALAVAVEHRPGSESRTAAVEELPSLEPEEFDDEAAFVEEEVELEIVEHGFSMVTDAAGIEYLLVAVVISNPHDGELVPGSLAIQTETERGYPVDLDTMYLGWLPPHSTAAFGYVTPLGAGDFKVEELRLEPLDPTILYPSEFWDDQEQFETDSLPAFAFTRIEPLTSPDGYRVHFQAEAPEATDAQIAVLFRDGEGRLIGGLPADGHDLYSSGFRSFPEGESQHFVDVTAEWIPEEADLDRIEIGPSRF